MHLTMHYSVTLKKLVFPKQNNIIILVPSKAIDSTKADIYGYICIYIIVYLEVHLMIFFKTQ